MAEEKAGAAGPLQESVGGSLGNIEQRLLDMALDADVKSVLSTLQTILSQVQSNGSGISEIKSSVSSLQSAVAQIPTTAGGTTDLTQVLEAVSSLATTVNALQKSVDEILTDLEGNPAPPAPAPPAP